MSDRSKLVTALRDFADKVQDGTIQHCDIFSFPETDRITSGAVDQIVHRGDIFVIRCDGADADKFCLTGRTPLLSTVRKVTL